MPLLLLALLQAALQSTTSSAVIVSFGDPVQHMTVSIEAIAKLPHKKVKYTANDGTMSEYEGVPLDEVLRLAKVPLGAELRGRSVAPLVLVANSHDGGKAVFAFAEIEPSFSDKLIMLAYKKDGKALGSDEGPFRIIAPGDKRHARWLRQVKSLEVKKH